MPEFSTLESVAEHQKRARAFVCIEAGKNLAGALADADIETESPIEAIFKLWWTALEMAGIERMRDLQLWPQYQLRADLGGYRFDFMICPRDQDFAYEGHKLGLNYQAVVIELDGHDFHERTKQQVAERNQRDRDLQALGYQVLHFSGSELYKDPVNCVTEAARAGSETLNAFSRKLRAKKQALGHYGELFGPTK